MSEGERGEKEQKVEGRRKRNGINDGQQEQVEVETE